MIDINHSLDTLAVAATAAPREDDPEPDVGPWWNGRILDPEDEEIIKNAYRQARKREAPIVAGVGRKAA